MKKILIPILILPLMFFTGCDEEEETPTGSTGSNDSVSYSIDDMVGTWNMTSNQTEGSALMDLSSLADWYSEMLSDLDQETCEYMEMTYDETTGCTMNDTVFAMMLVGVCAEMEGTLVGTTCTMNMLDVSCCDEGQSEVATITSDGAMTLVGVDEDGAWTDTGTISIDGTALILEIDEECECFELDETECESMVGCEYDDGYCFGEYDGDCLWTMTGILSVDGDTATMTMEVDFNEFLEDFMDDDDGGDDGDDCNYAMTEYDCDDCGGDWDAEDNYCYNEGEEDDFDFPMPTGSMSQVIVWEKVAE